MNIQDKMQAFMSYFHKQTHYQIICYQYNAIGQYANMEIWDEFHKAGIWATVKEEYLKQENYEEITKLIVDYMHREEIRIYGYIR